MAVKVKGGKDPLSPQEYKMSNFVTYAQMSTSNEMKPYIAAVMLEDSGMDDKEFVLGDGRNTSQPRMRNSRSTSTIFFNGPLEPGASYRIFQKVIVENVSFYE